MRKLLIVLIAAGLALVGCSQRPVHQESIGFEAADVEHMELYSYLAGDDTALYVDITEKLHVELWTSHFDNEPLYEPTPDQLDFAARGADVTGLRFHLTDGTVWERTHVFFGKGALFIDGDGKPLGVARYSSMGTLPLEGATRVDVSEAPPMQPR